MSVTFERAPTLPSWLSTRYPFARRAARVDGALVSFVDHGAPRGRPVLLVHGNPTWGYLWRKVVARLDAARYRVIVPDLLGFGASDKPGRPGEHRLAMHIDRIAALVGALELEAPFIAVGQDWGGPVAAGVAERHHARVGGLVFGNTAVLRPARPFRSKGFHRFSHTPIVSDVLFRGLLFPVPVMDRAQGDRASVGLREKAAYAWPLRHLRDRAGPLGLARMVPDREAHPSTAPMDRIGAFVEAWRGPSALVWGRRDPVLGRGLRRHREALPTASVRECDAGHFLQEEVPELFVEAIDEVDALAS